ncbi:hypothetical protein [Microvirga vignae]|uniref:hypothetical protein n=1 Tax=Microvirga vignae TaxID=1225564 RepID=UPI000B31373B|nr:hypothetical protein [Microvirga vignae]
MVWKYTPRQLAGFLWYAGRRIQRERAALLALQASAARGKPEDVKKQIKELSKE